MKKYTIQEIKALLTTDQINKDLLISLRSDQRKGVINLLHTYDRQKQQQKLIIKKHQTIANFDKAYRKRGFKHVAGVDEAGRGPLAGPVVAAAVILPKEFQLIGLTDSKKVKAADREKFYDIITKEAISYEIAIVDNDQIDEINILEATKRAMINALHNLSVQPSIALIDAVQLDNLSFVNEAIIKGDDKSLAIAAASILAKVTRDRIMDEIDSEYPVYEFKHHKGYGTKKHIEMMEIYGITKYHRKTFSPVNLYKTMNVNKYES